jgi:uncharacterized protein YndB with AHSA1/START domain
MSKTGMLIRRPVADVFEAFVNPDITTKFWFTASSGRLEAGRQVHWEWEMYGFAVQVKARAIEPNKRIVIEWSGYKIPTTVEWTFEPRGDTTFVTVTESGFGGSHEDVMRQVGDSAGGFSFVLAGLKAWLEHNVRLNLVLDRHPKGIGQ